MGKEYTEAQKKASIAYQKERKYIKAWVTPQQHAEYTAHAQSKGMPLGTLITELLENDMKKVQP